MKQWKTKTKREVLRRMVSEKRMITSEMINRHNKIVSKVNENPEIAREYYDEMMFYKVKILIMYERRYNARMEM